MRNHLQFEFTLEEARFSRATKLTENCGGSHRRNANTISIHWNRFERTTLFFIDYRYLDDLPEIKLQHADRVSSHPPPGTAPEGAAGEDVQGARRMPWHRKPMKDVASCDKPRGGANGL